MEALAGIGLVAPDDSCWQNSTGRGDVFEGDILDRNSWLSLAIRIQRVEHATWAFACGLLLLLGTNVDTPPERGIDVHVLEGNILDHSITIVSRIRFNIDGLEWVMEVNSSEGNVLNAIRGIVWRY